MNLENLGGMVGGFAVDFATPSAVSAGKPFAAAINAFLAALDKVTGPLQRLGSSLSSFVDKVSPATVERFTQRFRDFQAVIGTALRPVLERVTDLLKGISDRLYPLIQKLLPTIQRVVDEISDTLMRSLEDMAFSASRSGGIFKVLIEFLGALVKIVSDLMRAFLAFQRFLIYWVVGAPDLKKGMEGKDIGDLARDLFKKLHDAIMMAVKAVVLFAARLMHIFGWEKGLKALVTAFETMKGGIGEKKDTAGIAVAYNARFMSGQELGREVMLQAYRASMAGGPVKKPEEETNDWLKQIHKELMELRVDENDRLKQIVDMVKEKVQQVIEWVKDLIEKIQKNMADMLEMIRDLISKAVEGFMKWIGGTGLLDKLKQLGENAIGEGNELVGGLTEEDVFNQDMIAKFTEWVDERGTKLAETVMKNADEWYQKNVRKTVEDIQYSAATIADWVRRAKSAEQGVRGGVRTMIGGNPFLGAGLIAYHMIPS